MAKEYVVMTAIEEPFPKDPLPGEAVELRIVDLGCARCEHRIHRDHSINGEPVRWLQRCEFHKDLNVIQSRRAFVENPIKLQLELFPQETIPAQPTVD